MYKTQVNTCLIPIPEEIPYTYIEKFILLLGKLLD